MYIAAQALKKVKLTGDLEADREAAARRAARACKWTGATGAVQVPPATDKAGKPAGYDAKQAAIVSVTKGGKYVRDRKDERTWLAVLEQQLFNALSLGCVYALFALGFTLVFGVLGVINLSHGAVFMVGAYAALTGRHALAAAAVGRRCSSPFVSAAWSGC